MGGGGVVQGLAGGGASTEGGNREGEGTWMFLLCLVLGGECGGYAGGGGE